jgi:ABC-2 type transport system permease protein
MRATLATGHTPWPLIISAFALNLGYLALAGAVFAWTLRIARRRGLLVKVTSS